MGTEEIVSGQWGNVSVLRLGGRRRRWLRVGFLRLGTALLAPNQRAAGVLIRTSESRRSSISLAVQPLGRNPVVEGPRLDFRPIESTRNDSD